MCHECQQDVKFSTLLLKENKNFVLHKSTWIAREHPQLPNKKETLMFMQSLHHLKMKVKRSTPNLTISFNDILLFMVAARNKNKNLILKFHFLTWFVIPLTFFFALFFTQFLFFRHLLALTTTVAINWKIKKITEKRQS